MANSRKGTAERNLLQGLILLAAMGVKLRECKLEAARRHGKRAASFLGQTPALRSAISSNCLACLPPASPPTPRKRSHRPGQQLIRRSFLPSSLVACGRPECTSHPEPPPATGCEMIAGQTAAVLKFVYGVGNCRSGSGNSRSGKWQ